MGLAEIKAALGMVMVQDAPSAQHASMPNRAIATASIDYVLAASAMPEKLLAHAAALRSGAPRITLDAEPPETLHGIFSLIRERTGHDFSHYKRSALGRRIERRMAVHEIDAVPGYHQYLREHPREVDQLFKDLLIRVTSFFRDPQAWLAVRRSLEASLSDKPDDYVFRAWVPGCATGEEAYSLAILLRETLNALERPLSVQVFATDLDETAIDVARAGRYPRGIAADVSKARLDRFFVPEDDTYRVEPEIREMVVFAAQNLLSDPPFTTLDLISCRNVLIYLDAELQGRLIPTFHHALRPGGLLFLGSSESTGPFVDLFACLDKKAKLFRRSETAGPSSAELSAEGRPVAADLDPGGTAFAGRETKRASATACARPW